MTLREMRTPKRPFTGKYWNTDEKGTYYCLWNKCSDLVLNFQYCAQGFFFEQDNKNSVVYKMIIH
jgi:peptide methionine sulfoxide reductase MsrB